MEHYRWIVYAALGAVAAASIAPLGKKGVEHLDPTVVTGVRSVAQALAVVLLVTLLGGWGALRQFDARAVGYAALTGLAGAASWVFMFLALGSPGGDASRVMPVDKMSMPLGVILAVAFLGERPTGTNWAGIALMSVGAVLAAWPRS
jgi:transporter family protein